VALAALLPARCLAASTANNPLLNYDPLITTNLSFDDRNVPVNNPLTSGTGTGLLALTALVLHSSVYNFQYSQGFQTGTTFFTAWNNTRSSSTSAANLFNPSVNSTIFAGFQQQFTERVRAWRQHTKHPHRQEQPQNRGLGLHPAGYHHSHEHHQLYWELAFARENVKVQQQAVTVAEKLYNDNKKQLEIGTMAPLEVTRAESELATNRQNLIVAQTLQLQDQQVLKNANQQEPSGA